MNAEIVVFPFLHNWVQEVKFKYNFITSLFKNKRFVEQRRTMKNLVLREEDLFFTKNEIEKNLLLNKLMYAQDKRIAVPVYPELCFTSTFPLLGVSTLVIVENLTEYWNFSNACTHVLIIQDYSTYELIQKNYITANSIVLENAISVTFTGVVEIYPVIFCSMRDIKITHVTSKVYTMGLSFQEIRTYQHTETEEDAQADYLLYNYSKSNPADVVIPDFTITKNGDITITPTPPPPVETPIIVIVSKDTGGNVLRTQEKVLDENGEVKITKVGDEVYIQIGYKYTNMLSGNVDVPVDFWVTNVVDWWNEKDKSVDGLNRDIQLINDGEGLGKIIDHKEVSIYAGITYNTLVTKTLKSKLSAYTLRQEPLFWTYDSYTDSGLLPEDYYTNFMGFSGDVPSGWDRPDGKSYPPPGQYNDTDLFVMKVKEFYTDLTSRTTIEDTAEQGAYYYLGRTFAYHTPPNLWVETIDANYFRIYAPGFSSNVARGFIPTASYRGYVYQGTWLIGEVSGTFAIKAGHYGSVIFPRAGTAWGIPSYPPYPRNVIIQMIYGGVEMWFPAEDCAAYFI